MRNLEDKIFNIKSSRDFIDLSLQVFKFQYQENEVYRLWCDYLGKNSQNVKRLNDIPFLPIEFFKTHDVVAFKERAIHKFISSGTTKERKSTHWIKDLSLYERSFCENFEYFFGDSSNYCFLIVLPSYAQNPFSSLIYMMEFLVKNSHYKDSGFYNENYSKLIDVIKKNESKSIPTILFGVSYALLDLIEMQKFELKHTLVFETGGMKGRRKELIKQALHDSLCRGFAVDKIYSEYGMCELFSQAYSKGGGIFYTPAQMKILLRDVNDPLSLQDEPRGVINVIDLANLYSCSFIATEDLGEKHADGGFEIIGRLDNSALRGCNLMYL
jgi:hypothetical protein